MYLLDTNVLVWMALSPDRFSQEVQDDLFLDPVSVAASAINFWDIAIKRSRDPSLISIDLDDLRSALRAIGYPILPFTTDHALAVQGLPQIHRDPFDRGLIAQAMAEDLTLLTRDRIIPRYPVKTLSV